MTRTRRRSARRLWVCGIDPAAALGAPWSGLRINWTSSMPVGLYLQTETTLERGSTVLVCLPDAITRVGRSRGYLPAGGCPNDSSPVVKQVLALPGDVVELHEQFVAVNRRLVEASGIGRS